MISLCQVFDESCDWQHRVASAQLADRLPSSRFDTSLASVDAAIAREFNGALSKRITAIPRIGGINLLAAPMLGRWLSQQSADIVHAWGPGAGAAAAFASRRPLVIELFDPREAVRSAKLMRAIARKEQFAIVCSSQTIRRRLVEHGVPAGVCVTIRPAVDFARIQKAKKSGLRSELGLNESDYVILLSETASRGGPRLEAYWAGALLRHLDGPCRVVVHGSGAEVERTARFAAAQPTPSALVAPGNSVSYEDLLAMADALVVPESGDVPTTEIAWAFAAGAAVIAAAGYAVTELVVSRVNGLLYKQTPGVSAGLRIVPLLRDREGQRKVREAARGHAYEVFSLRRYMEQHVQVYENLLAGRAPGDGIADPAQVA